MGQKTNPIGNRLESSEDGILTGLGKRLWRQNRRRLQNQKIP